MGSESERHPAILRELAGRKVLRTIENADFGQLALAEMDEPDDEGGMYEWIGLARPFDNAVLVCSAEDRMWTAAGEFICRRPIHGIELDSKHAREIWRTILASPETFLAEARGVVRERLPLYPESKDEIAQLGGFASVAESFNLLRIMFGGSEQFSFVLQHKSAPTLLAHMIAWRIGQYGCEELTFYPHWRART